MSLQDEIKKVLQEYRGKILTLPHVIGVGIGYRITARQTTAELSIMILVRKKLPPAGLEAKAIAPQEIQGIRTDVLEVGDIRPLKYYTNDSFRPTVCLDTEIKHIQKEEKGRFRGHYFIGLDILDQEEYTNIH